MKNYGIFFTQNFQICEFSTTINDFVEKK